MQHVAGEKAVRKRGYFQWKTLTTNSWNTEGLQLMNSRIAIKYKRWECIKNLITTPWYAFFLSNLRIIFDKILHNFGASFLLWHLTPTRHSQCRHPLFKIALLDSSETLCAICDDPTTFYTISRSWSVFHHNSIITNLDNLLSFVHGS